VFISRGIKRWAVGCRCDVGFVPLRLEGAMQETPRSLGYRVHADITALKYVSGRLRFITIPRGSVITVSGTPKEFDLVDVEWQGETLAVFERDIRERAEEV
jgi:uncharacterized lipoprotein YbaY